MKMREVTRFEVKVAGLQNPQILEDAGWGLGAIGEFMEKMESPCVQVVASSGRGPTRHLLDVSDPGCSRARARRSSGARARRHSGACGHRWC